LHITSKPPGANIVIDGKPRQELTDTTLVVSPGTYKVAVTGGPGNLNCPEKEYTVSPGQIVEVTCP
ncbi:MAG: PEGA domain-containing protein, partial [Candidatus Korobacteraceae bacterium]